MNSDVFCTKPRGSVWFAVYILGAEPNQTKPNRKNNEYYLNMY